MCRLDPQVPDAKGWEWRLLLMPDGNVAHYKGQLSIFLELANKDIIAGHVREPLPPILPHLTSNARGLWVCCCCSRWW